MMQWLTVADIMRCCPWHYAMVDLGGTSRVVALLRTTCTTVHLRLALSGLRGQVFILTGVGYDLREECDPVRPL